MACSVCVLVGASSGEAGKDLAVNLSFFGAGGEKLSAGVERR